MKNAVKWACGAQSDLRRNVYFLKGWWGLRRELCEGGRFLLILYFSGWAWLILKLGASSHPDFWTSLAIGMMPLLL